MKDLINQNNISKLKINNSYLMTYNYVGTKYGYQTKRQKSKIRCPLHDSYSSLDYQQINWHENKMCHQMDDSYLPVTNDLDNHGASGRSIYKVNWLVNRMCRHLNDSSQPAGNAHDMYGVDIDTRVYAINLGQINWLKNKMCRQINDSQQPLKNTGAGYVELKQINWLKYKICRSGKVNKIKIKIKHPINSNYLATLALRPSFQRVLWLKSEMCRQAYPWEAAHDMIKSFSTKGRTTTVTAPAQTT